uniref:Uncharacterized protein n=1 Tax=Eutreptiella gymnastica TaxID=73025 RepID=A0A7S4C845_9EUGL
MAGRWCPVTDVGWMVLSGTFSDTQKKYRRQLSPVDWHLIPHLRSHPQEQDQNPAPLRNEYWTTRTPSEGGKGGVPYARAFLSKSKQPPSLRCLDVNSGLPPAVYHRFTTAAVQPPTVVG